MGRRQPHAARVPRRLLAWAGLEDSRVDDADAAERDVRLAEEVEELERRKASGEIDPGTDAAALLLIGLSAGNALAVYPHLARALFGADRTSPDVVRRYADQPAALMTRASR